LLLAGHRVNDDGALQSDLKLYGRARGQVFLPQLLAVDDDAGPGLGVIRLIADDQLYRLALLCRTRLPRIPALGASRATHASVDQIPIRLLSFDIPSLPGPRSPGCPGLIDVSKTAMSPETRASGRRPGSSHSATGKVACSCHDAAASRAYARERSARKGLRTRCNIRALNYEIGTFDPCLCWDGMMPLLKLQCESWHPLAPPVWAQDWRNEMPAKNHKQWLADPPLQPGDGLTARVYSDPRIFEDELKNIFRRTWIPVCHESELPNFVRLPHHQHRPRADHRVPRSDNEVRAFLNVCAHRGMIIERRPSGSFLDGQPSGNPKRMTCMFHAWQYDLKGNCVYISREKEGYQDRLCKENVGLRRLRCEVKFGGSCG